MRSQIRGVSIVAALGTLALLPRGVPGAEWCPPVPLESLNSAGNDNGPEPAMGARTLYLASNRPGGESRPPADTSGDLYVAWRDNPREAWSTPETVDPAGDPEHGVNTFATENAPALSSDRHVLYFSSDRPGGIVPTEGGNGPNCGPNPVGLSYPSSCDIWWSERRHTQDDLAWSEPVNLGPPVNTGRAEIMGDLFEDESTGRTELYFTRDRPPSDPPAGGDIYVSELGADGVFSEPVLIEEVSSPATESRVTILPDGLTMYFQSNREGSTVGANGQPSMDLWVATRESTDEPWSPPTRLGPEVNTPGFEGGPRLASGGRVLYFFSNGHPGSAGVDLFASERARGDGSCGERP